MIDHYQYRRREGSARYPRHNRERARRVHHNLLPSRASSRFNVWTRASTEWLRRLPLSTASVAVVPCPHWLTGLRLLMDQVQISLSVACSGLDADGVAGLTTGLRSEILGADVDRAE